MRIMEIDAKQELQALAALVFNDKVIAASSPYIEREAFKSQFSFKIADKCAKHHTKYHKAPRLLIYDYIEGQIEHATNKEETKQLQSILDSLYNLKKSVNGKHSNDKYLIDRTTKYLTQTKFGSLTNLIKNSVDNGEMDKAMTLSAKLNRVSLNGNGHIWYDSYMEDTLVIKLLEGKSRPLIQYSGILGDFFGDQLNRENFVAFQGPEKSFKSFWLQEIAHKGLKEGLKVMFIGIGDMSSSQYQSRMISRLAGRPWNKGEYWYPTGWKNPGEYCTLPTRKKKKVGNRITKEEIDSARNQFSERYFGGTKKFGKYMKMIVEGEMSVSEIESHIMRFQDLESWSPDVLVIDYADRLSPPKGVQDKIMQTEQNWNRLREIALQQHCLVVTATQTRRSGYKGHPQTRDDVSDSKSKTAVVTGLIGINAFEEEYKYDTRRLNWVVCREHTKRSVISVAGCPAIANPAVLSI